MKSQSNHELMSLEIFTFSAIKTSTFLIVIMIAGSPKGNGNYVLNLNCREVQNCINRGYLHIIKEDEFPTIEMGTDCYIHILHSCPLKPASRFLQCFDSPNSSSTIEAKEIKVDPINLLLHLKVEAHINILEACQQVFILVHKGPSSLNQTQLRSILQTSDRNKLVQWKKKLAKNQQE